jgi:hypothetical protein
METGAMDRKQEMMEKLDCEEGPKILEEIEIEELFIDGI